MGILVAPRISFRQMHDMGLGKSLSYVCFRLILHFCFICGIQVASKSIVESIPFLNGVLILLCEYETFLIIEVVMLILFQPACFSSSESDHFNIRDINSKFSKRYSFHLPNLPLFSHPPTLSFSSRTQISYSSILLLMGSLSIIFCQCANGGQPLQDGSSNAHDSES